MATHTSILAWRIPWTEEPGGLQFMGSQESNTTQQLNHQQSSAMVTTFFFFFVVTMNSWILFIQCFAIIIVISVFNDQIVLIMAWGSPLNWLLVLLMCSHYSLSTFLLSGITKCSRLTLYFPCAKPGISHSSKEPWLLSVRRDIQKLEARHQVYSLLLWSPEAFLKDKII